MNLTRSSIDYGTDKGPLKHYFTDLYENYFKSFVDKKDPNFKLLEIGVANGSSIRMWLDYFRVGHIYGMDLKDSGLKNERFKFFKGNQHDEKLLKEVVNSAGMFDIIIDDGSHDTFDMDFTFKFLFRYLKPGGLYVIEDLDYRKCPKMAKNMMEFEKTAIYDDVYITENTDSCINHVLSTGHICFIQKKIFNLQIDNEVEQQERFNYNVSDKSIEFTTTATIRPEIHEKTYSSFHKNLKGINFHTSILYLNIDPMPVDKTDYIEDCIKVAEKYFGTVVPHIPSMPNYSNAYNWVWSQCKGDYIFNLEDDWELLKEININELLWYFKNNKHLYQVVLRAYSYIYPSCCTSPGVYSKRFYKAIAGKLFANKNPENQIHHRGKDFGLDFPFKRNKVNPLDRVIAHPFPDKDVRYVNEEIWLMVKDLGREWMEGSGYKLPDKKVGFTTWQKV